MLQWYLFQIRIHVTTILDFQYRASTRLRNLELGPRFAKVCKDVNKIMISKILSQSNLQTSLILEHIFVLEDIPQGTPDSKTCLRNLSLSENHPKLCWPLNYLAESCSLNWGFPIPALCFAVSQILTHTKNFVFRFSQLH